MTTTTNNLLGNFSLNDFLENNGSGTHSTTQQQQAIAEAAAAAACFDPAALFAEIGINNLDEFAQTDIFKSFMQNWNQTTPNTNLNAQSVENALNTLLSSVAQKGAAELLATSAF